MRVIDKSKAVARRVLSPIVAAKNRARKSRLYSQLHTNLDPARHIAEAAEWLCRAQDHGRDRGVSYGADFGTGFLPSYPETTGYIICTFLALARRSGNQDFVKRAIEMGTWEAEIQMDSGAVMGGMYDESTPTPAVFNTGMVLLGWADLYAQTGSVRFGEAGRRAAEWLL